MDLDFANAKPRKRYETFKEAVRTWGQKCAEKLFQRLAELEDSESLAVVARLPGARCHELKARELVRVGSPWISSIQRDSYSARLGIRETSWK